MVINRHTVLLDLRDNNMAEFSWFYPFPGDWHMTKLISEIIKDLLWDGGLKQFCSKCGIDFPSGKIFT